MSDITDILTQGLINSYTGKTTFKKIKRAEFNFLSSHFKTDNSTYHDEWLDVLVGGGQEIVKLKDEKFTRLYGGGVVDNKTLTSLKISEKDIINFLISQIKKHKTKTRLFTNCISISDNWKYEYKILEKVDSISLTITKETIYYQGKEVFVHAFLLCPIIK